MYSHSKNSKKKSRFKANDHTNLENKRSYHRRRIDMLTDIGQMITSELKFDNLLNLVVEQSNKILDTRRCSIFLIDDKDKYLTAFVSVDLKKTFTLSKNQGIAGTVYSNKKTLMVNDAYNDPRFCSTADEGSGFHTKNLICTPLMGYKKTVLEQCR